MRLGMSEWLMQAASDGTAGSDAPMADVPLADVDADAGAAAMKAAGMEAAAAPELNHDWLPEKFHVKNEAGELDLVASARKQAESYAELEAWKGTGEAPPKAAALYSYEVPEDFSEYFDFRNDARHDAFREGALKAGLTQSQFEYVFNEFFDVLPDLIEGVTGSQKESGAAMLKEAWPTEREFSENLRSAYQGAATVAKMAGLDLDDVLESPIANDPHFVRLMAAINHEFREDAPPSGMSSMPADIQSLMASEAYLDPKHPEHGAASARVKAYYDQTYGNERSW